jgi:hypothetical protein
MRSGGEELEAWSLDDAQAQIDKLHADHHDVKYYR